MSSNIDRELLFAELEIALLEHYHEPDIEAAMVLYSAAAAHYLPGPQVWAMIVAPPGSMKTELLQALDGLPNVHFIDSLTPRTLISGKFEDSKFGGSNGSKQQGKQSASLLHRLGDRPILVAADFTTIQSMRTDDRATVLGQLRRIYDGDFSVEFGTAENLSDRRWKGRLSFLAGTTPSVDQHQAIFQSMGERFLLVRSSRAGGDAYGVNAAVEAMNQDRPRARADLKQAVHALILNQLTTNADLSAADQLKIASLAEFTAHGRTQIPRDGRTKVITDIAHIESPTRLAQQLIQLARGSAALSGRSSLGEGDIQIARRAAFDSIPGARRKIINALLRGGSVSDAVMPKSTRSYYAEELEAVGLVSGKTFTDHAQRLLRQADITPDRPWIAEWLELGIDGSIFAELIKGRLADPRTWWVSSRDVPPTPK